MKILIISDLYPLTTDRTIPSVVEDFAFALNEKVEKVEVIRPNFIFNTILRRHKIVKSGEYVKNNIKIYNRNFILPFIFENKKFIRKFLNFDIIISHMPSGHMYANLINRVLNLPHISIVHQSDYKVLSDFRYAFYFRKRLSRALMESSFVGARNFTLFKKLNCDFILPSFVDKKNIKEKKIFNSDKIKFITLSKFIKRKNLDLVIKALNRVDYDFEYNIYGEGPEKKRLLKLISKYNLEGKVKINGYVNHDEVYKKLNENDVFILPSKNETFGVSYFEALSCGLVVIASKNTGMDGIIENGENGFLTEVNVDSIAEVLNKIKECNLEEISKKGTKLIKNYEKEKIITKYFEFIKKTL